MSTRWFFSSAQLGAGVAATGAQNGRSVLRPTVVFTRTGAEEELRVDAPGPQLSLLGPGDVMGFQRALVIREEPVPGCLTASENTLACVEFAHADLPWQLAAGRLAPGQSDNRPVPWLALIVLEESEAAPPAAGGPLPVVTAPVQALQPLAENWAWAHVEARLDDGVTDAVEAARLAGIGLRARSGQVIARLICPRRLASDRGWFACVVPATAAGREAGLQRSPEGLTGDAWPTDQPEVELPVYHWWRFRTGKEGTFEDLARRLEFRPASEAGLGTRIVDVSRPWPGEAAQAADGPVTVAVDGALRVPEATGGEVWSDPAAQERFRELIRERIDEPGRRLTVPETPPDPAQPPPGQQAAAVAAPLYGSHHSGELRLPAQAEAEAEPESWLTTLNLEVRRRVAAALGTRYVQLEQEFLMARAWEQVGEIRRANRLLATAELAAAVAERSQSKHLEGLAPSEVITAMAPVRHRIPVAVATPVAETEAPATLGGLLDSVPGFPSGTADTAFARLTRHNGALARRVRRTRPVSGEEEAPPSEEPTKLETALANVQFIAPSEPGLAAPEPGATGLVTEIQGGLRPLPLHLRRMADRIPVSDVIGRSEDDPRPLRPIMRHPDFEVPMAEELLERWPEWAIPGIGGLPPDSATLLETNPQFIEALLVGLNHEFNRELLWREYPTDQRGTPFARFWPDPSGTPEVDEIARWAVTDPLGSHARTGGEGSLALLVRGELLRRFPGTPMVAVQGVNGRLPADFQGVPANPLPLDEATVLYLFPGIDDARARSEGWMFVFREPMRGTQFGFDLAPAGTPPDAPPPAAARWSDLTWAHVPVTGGRHIVVRPGALPTPPEELASGDPPEWGRDPADMARIAFQQPFQLAFDAVTMLGP
ncbi:hypothetical protein [Streptomyces sp. NPDC003023]|uniref:hypothetical protein n=1 Tax=Streptomyces sp. NPDC003023 TaxID=3364675 RepID=UPI0036AFD1B1